MNPQLNQLKELLDYGKTQVVSKEEMKLFLTAILKAIKEMKDDNAVELRFLTKSLKEIEKELTTKTGSATTTAISEAKRLIGEAIGKVEAKIPLMPDMTELEAKMEGMHSMTMEEVAGNMPMLGEQCRDALELLDGDERLEIKAIKDLREELDELRKLIKTGGSSTVYVGGGSSGGGRIMKIYDLSSQLNGVLKTFSLPAFYRVISVHSASFPFSAFRPTTDYTTDGSAMTITFTDQISASTTLATNQSLLVEYAEL